MIRKPATWRSKGKTLQAEVPSRAKAPRQEQLNVKNCKTDRMTRALQARGDRGQTVLSHGLSGYREDSECILFFFFRMYSKCNGRSLEDFKAGMWMIWFMILKGCSAAIGSMGCQGARSEAKKARIPLSEPSRKLMVVWIRTLVMMQMSGQIWVCTWLACGLAMRDCWNTRLSFTAKGKIEGEKQVWGGLLVGKDLGLTPQGAVISTPSGK